MALWTPYKEDAVKEDDLTKRGAPEEQMVVPDYKYTEYDQSRDDRCYNYVYGSIAPPSQISPVESGNGKVPSPPSASADSLETDSLSEDVEYQSFEQDALRAMAEKNGGKLLGNNPRMRRAVQANKPPDDSYRAQREKNNLAAKQSRDRRKLREARLAFQVTYLKKKIVELRTTLIERACSRCHQQCRC